MRRRLTPLRFLAVLGMLAATMVPNAGPASAHTADSYFPYTWETEWRTCTFLGFFCTDHTRDVEYWTVGSFTSSQRVHIDLGLTHISSISTGEYLNMRRVGSRNFLNACPGGTYNFNTVRWDSLSSDYVASAWSCVTGDEMYSSEIVWNTYHSGKWYWSTGTPPSTHFDADDPLLHEFVHGLGWGGRHWSDSSSLCPGTESRHIMCESTAYAIRLDKLRTHDIDTIDDAYTRLANH